MERKTLILVGVFLVLGLIGGYGLRQPSEKEGVVVELMGVADRNIAQIDSALQVFKPLTSQDSTQVSNWWLMRAYWQGYKGAMGSLDQEKVVLK